ncbi:CRISPR-associated endoribonuclease Cas6 [Paenibacillus apiarius]|uniref:CRISPR-associated endoribonuclease Cas6 n=1 Tax=Paenibacillus apiarius TaxID=46240 RepID=UPI003B3BE918
MRIKITLTFDGKLIVPINHQEWLHGLIYHSIRDDGYRDFLHNTGYQQGKRQFRMFTFSKLNGSHRLDRNSRTLEFSPPHVSFIFSAYDKKLVQELVSSLLIRDDLRLGSHLVKVGSVEQIHDTVSEKMVIHFLTPVTMYSTFLLHDKKKTYFYSPWEEEFSPLIKANALKKYEALYGEVPASDMTISLSPLHRERIKPRTSRFKSTVIKGWTGDFILEGDLELIRLTYDVGLGGKNSNGHGLYDIVRHLSGGYK